MTDSIYSDFARDIAALLDIEPTKAQHVAVRLKMRGWDIEKMRIKTRKVSIALITEAHPDALVVYLENLKDKNELIELM